MNRIYFDNAATTSLDPEVLGVMLPFLTEQFGNPSSIYSYGRETRLAIEQSRKSVARILNAKPSEIFFTSGGTESNNTAIQMSVRDLHCTHIISSAIEHHAVTHTVEHLQKSGLVKASMVKLLPNGHVDLDDLERLLEGSKEKTLVSLMHANNEIGNMLDWKKTGELCKKYDAYFHCDTVQTVGHFPIDLSEVHVHFITGAAHKFHGPKGVGILFINEKVKIHPFIFGGGQERNMRAGTENIYGIVGFAKALELAMAHFEKDKEHIFSVRQYMKEQLLKHISGVQFNGDHEGNCLYTVLNVGFPRTEKSEMLLFNLDIHHICASGGSACSSGAEGGSHVINSICPGSRQVTVRFSFCKNNSKYEVDAVIARLKELV